MLSELDLILPRILGSPESLDQNLLYSQHFLQPRVTHLAGQASDLRPHQCHSSVSCATTPRGTWRWTMRTPKSTIEISRIPDSSWLQKSLTDTWDTATTATRTTNRNEWGMTDSEMSFLSDEKSWNGMIWSRIRVFILDLSNKCRTFFHFLFQIS